MIYGILTTSQIYTSLELYAYPFDELTWIFVIGSFIIGLYIAFVFDRFYARCLLIRLAIGFPPFRTPSLNVVRFMLGQSLMELPEAHFARFTIVAWYIYGILLRTAYQSLLFQLAKLNVYHEPPKTLKELVMKDYTLVMNEVIYDVVQNIPRINQGVIDVIKLKNVSQQSPFFYMDEHDHKQCLASVSPKDFLTYHMIQEKKRGAFYELPENIFTVHITTYFSKHSFLTSRFNELVLSMRSMGLIKFWAQQNLDDRFLDNEHERTFSPITLNDLEGIFYIYGILISISIIAFFSEIIIFKLHNHEADLSLGSFRYTLERSSILTAALPYYQTYQIYGILTTSQLFTSLELLLYPFDTITWIFLFGSIFLGLFISFIVQQFYNQSKLIRIAIGFPPFRTPYMNIFRIFLGQNLIQISNTYFARFIIVAWHIYALLFRTVYQSLLFQSVKLNVYHEPPQTLTDLINRQCILVMTEGTYDSVNTVPRIAQGIVDVIIIKNSSEQSTFFYVEYHHIEHQCVATVSSKDFLSYHIIKENKRGLFYMLPEKIFAQHITMYFSKHSYLITRFNELFMNLRSMGLIDFWAHQSLDTSIFNNKHESTFSPINLNNLNGTIIIYSVLILMGISIFLMEIIVLKINKLISD